MVKYSHQNQKETIEDRIQEVKDLEEQSNYISFT